MAPTITNPTARIVQAASAEEDFPNTYISGYSKVKLSAKCTLPTIAGVSSFYAILPDGQQVSLAYNSTTQAWEGTTAKAITGNGEYKIGFRVVDERGMSAELQNAVTINVVSYKAPYFVVNVGPERCDEDGLQVGTLDHFKFRITPWVHTSGLTGNAIKHLYAGFSGGTLTDISSNPTNTKIIDGLTNEEQSYTVEIQIQDKICASPVTRQYLLPGKRHDLIIRHGDAGTHVGVGMQPDNSSGRKSDIQLPNGGGYFLNGVDIRTIAHGIVYDQDVVDELGKDILAIGNTQESIINANLHINIDSNDISNWQNIPNAVINNASLPYTGFSCIRSVLFIGTSTVIVILLERMPSVFRIWYREKAILGTTWGPWKRIESTADASAAS